MVGRFLGEGFGLWWEDFGLLWEDLGFRDRGGFRAFVGRIWGFVGIRAFVGGGSGFRAFVARDSGWGGFRALVAWLSRFRGDGFGFWWGGFRGRVSGVGGRLLGSLGGLSCGGSWAFVGRIRLS